MAAFKKAKLERPVNATTQFFWVSHMMMEATRAREIFHLCFLKRLSLWNSSGQLRRTLTAIFCSPPDPTNYPRHSIRGLILKHHAMHSCLAWCKKKFTPPSVYHGLYFPLCVANMAVSGILPSLRSMFWSSNSGKIELFLWFAPEKRKDQTGQQHSSIH